MSEDAGKIIFICSFIQIDDLFEGCGLACTDPGITSPVLPQKPSKPAKSRRESTATLVLPTKNGSKGIQSNLSISTEHIYPSWE